MLKRTIETARVAAESVGLIEPSMIDAQAAAETRRQDLIVAKQAVTSAESDLEQLYDSGADHKALTAAEAHVADALMKAERAQRHYTSAEKRLATAKDYAAANARAAMRAKLQTAIEARAKAAQRIDTGAGQIAEAVRDLRSHDNVIRQAMASNLLGNDASCTIRDVRRLVDLSLQKSGAIEGGWIGDPAERPNCTDIVEKDNTLLAAA